MSTLLLACGSGVLQSRRATELGNTAWTSPSGNTGLGFYGCLVTTLSSTDQCIA